MIEAFTSVVLDMLANSQATQRDSVLYKLYSSAPYQDTATAIENIAFLLNLQPPS